MIQTLKSISPLDGRYKDKLVLLEDYFSEFALFKYRLQVEIEYLIYLQESLPEKNPLTEVQKKSLRKIAIEFTTDDAEKIKLIEKTIRHDVKAVEYYLKEELNKLNLSTIKEFVHFGLTSQDINNTAVPLLLRDFTLQCLLPKLTSVCDQINHFGQDWKKVPMLARTHGQPASPTTLGKEMLVFSERLERQIRSMQDYEYSAKFGGATGNFNAHHVAYPKIDWPHWAKDFLQTAFHLKRQHYTTQIAHYDEIAEWNHILIRINSILMDFCRDIWSYVSMDYFQQKIKPGEIGSSAMPHKVNPIDFENAEGNLGLSTALASHLAEKLPVSRLQRDLTDSTVLRNLGVPAAHHYLALLSIDNGLSKLIVNEPKIREDLNDQWIILSEAIQTILRREGYQNPYEIVKDLTRGKTKITQKELHDFIINLNIPENLKTELKALRPDTYLGVIL